MATRRPLVSLARSLRPAMVLVLLASLPLASPVELALGAEAVGALGVLQQRQADLQKTFIRKLEALAEDCERRGIVDGAAIVREAIPADPADDRPQMLTLPTKVQSPVAQNLPADQRYWSSQLRTIREELATQLYLLSRQALHRGYPSYAFQLVRQTAEQNPDHRQAREILGYVQYGDEWVTPFARKMLREQYVWTTQYGWIKKAHVTRYDQGERLFEGRWVSAEKEGESRRDFSQAWQIRTDHYLIRTNHSLEQGARLGLALEDFYQLFHETFAGFFNTPEQMRKRFDGTSPVDRTVTQPYRVNYYRTREEYVNRLQPTFPQIALTNGIYAFGEKIAHFYHTDGEAADRDSTLFHEATHQLFYESHGSDRAIGEHAQFWIIEGIACYMESFRRGSGAVSLGDPRYVRFVNARDQLLRHRFYVPLQQLSGMGMREFQSSPDLPAIYAQSSGLAQFLMHYEQGIYREDLVKLLSQMYSSDARIRTQAQGLDDLTGVPFDVLDEQYEDFLKQQDAEVASRPTLQVVPAESPLPEPRN